MSTLQGIGALVFGALTLLLIGVTAIVFADKTAILLIVLGGATAYAAQLFFYWQSLSADMQNAEECARYGNILWVVCLVLSALSLIFSLWI